MQKIGSKLALFKKKAYKILEAPSFQVDPLVNALYARKGTEMGVRDYGIFCELCILSSAMVHTVVRYNDQAKQRYQVGLIAPTAEDPLALLESHGWFGPS